MERARREGEGHAVDGIRAPAAGRPALCSGGADVAVPGFGPRFDRHGTHQR
ncbi:MAG TPA: hypothetical protein VMM59_04900 [Thermohalobaculum sp.]|nr:hypothetical protein [Thermohalobaculum sp.]